MKKLIVIFLLLFPALALAQDKCCVLGLGKCMPLQGSADEEACGMLKGKILSEPCDRVEQCSKPGKGKCCIQKEYENCFSANTPAAAARCKGQIIDCPCPPHCRPSCEP
jgi:hypothetical protein